MTKRNLFAGALSIGLCLLMLPAAFAAEYGQPDITVQTTIKQIRENPSIAGSGIYVYGNSDEHCRLLQACFENETVAQYLGEPQAEDGAKGLNMVIRNYNAGVQVTWPVYTAEEIAAVPARGDAELYYFPAEQPGAKYAIVMGGNVATTSGELREGVTSVPQLHERGYAVFVLRYRTFLDASDNAPLEDLGRAVQFITEHAGQFGVQTEDYALIGYSSGGQMAGLFGNSKIGYARYGVPKPGALILAYPVIDFNEVKPVYHVLMDPAVYDWRFYWSSVADAVTDDYPPTYFWYGKNDFVLPLMDGRKQGPAFAQALEAHGVLYKKTVYQNAPHGCGTGCGTDAEGWLNNAVTFWEEQTK